jgi:Rrf2 family protein
MLSHSAMYAIRALSCVVRAKGAPLLVREIATTTGISASYLAKLVNTLARKGFVHTQRGVRGGVSLAKVPESVTLYDVSVALDEPVTQDQCYLGIPTCSAEAPCAAHAFWKVQRRREIRFLRKTTLAEVALYDESHPGLKIVAPALAAV